MSRSGQYPRSLEGSNVAVPNLPGMVPNKESWLHRQDKGFRSTSQARTTSNNLESLAEIAKKENIKGQSETNTSDVGDGTLFTGRTKPLLGSDANHDMSSLISGSYMPAALKADKRTLLSTKMIDEKSVKKAQPVVPKYILAEKKVLRFYGYFEQGRKWDEGDLGKPSIEAVSVRFLVIHYYIDETVEIVEHTVENSGLAQGRFYKKDFLLKDNGGFLKAEDLYVGNTVSLLGQKILIYDADEATRNYYAKHENIVFPPALEVPKSTHGLGAAHATGLSSHVNAPIDSNTAAKSGDYDDKKKQLNKEFRYFHGDKRVLRFVCEQLVREGDASTMADQMLGKNMKFSLAYYLVDDTMEVNTIRTRRASSADLGTLFKRGHCPKNWRETSQDKVFYSPSDLICGTVINLYGRRLKIVDCDDTTRSIYREMNIDQKPNVESPNEVRKKEEIQTTEMGLNIGSGTDSRSASLGTKVVADKDRDVVLKAELSLVSENHVDKKRKFHLSYFLENDMVSIFEEVVKNSGVAGGTFLKKGYYKLTPHGNSKTERLMCSTDIYQGAILRIGGKVMQVISIDPKTCDFFRSKPEEYPMYSEEYVAGILLDKSILDKKDFRLILARYDKDFKFHFRQDLFEHIMDTEEIWTSLTSQEQSTLLSHICFPNTEGGMNAYYVDFFDLMAYVHLRKTGGKASRMRSHMTEKENAKRGLLRAFRDSSPNWRRLFRSASTSFNGCVVFDDLVKICEMNGIPISKSNVALLVELYALSKDQQFQVLQEMEAIGVTIDSKKAPPAVESGPRSLASLRNAPQYVPASVQRSKEVKETIIISYHYFCDDIYDNEWIE
jgi:hypothetical protein